MSVIAVGGRPYAAGLYWLERRGARATARTARRLARPWCVHHGERTGFVGAGAADGSPEGPGPADPGSEGIGPEGLGPEGLGPEGLGPEGLPALALALLAHLGDGFWMALVEGRADSDGGPPRYGLVKARGGAVLADGDEVFDDRAAALAAFERARGLGWALHATPGLIEDLEDSGPEAAVLDPAALGDAAARAGTAIELVRALPASGGGFRPLHAALGAAAIVAALGSWLGRDALLELIEEAEIPAAPVAEAPDPEVAVAVDGAALAAACRRALAERPPFLPGWEIEGIACSARFGDAELAALRPELSGKPVLLVRWGLAAGHAEAIARRLAERHLSGWHAGAVVEGRAWAAAPLGPVLRVVNAPAPSFLELREAVDRAFGAGGARLGYVRDAGGAWTLRIEAAGPLAGLGSAAGGIAGLEVTGLSRRGDGWRIDARPAAPETVRASRLGALGIHEHRGSPARGGAGDGKEDGNGTKDDRGA